MCGIAAIYSYHYAAPGIDREELGRITNHMESRGPDGKGEWYSDDGRVGLGHRRLSIIDLSDRAAQPMSTPDGKFVISYNGEIYNYKELRRRLVERGYVFQSHSDTEVLLHLYAEKGEDMLHDLRACLRSPFGIDIKMPCCWLATLTELSPFIMPMMAGRSVLLLR